MGELKVTVHQPDATRVRPLSTLASQVWSDSSTTSRTGYARHSSPGMMRCMNSSNNGTVNAVSP